MMLEKFAIVSIIVGFAVMGCGGVEDDPITATAQLALHDDDCDSDSDSDSDQLRRLRRTFRRVTRIYRNPDNLAPNGFVPLQDTCFEEDEGAVQLGLVYLRPAIVDGVINKNKPEILYYEPRADGSLRLMGGEYFCPIEACPTPPTLFGQTFRFEADTNGHALHVWAWLRNPNGLTAPSNPRVDTTYCP